MKDGGRQGERVEFAAIAEARGWALSDLGSTQFLVAPSGSTELPGLRRLALGRVDIHYGDKVPLVEARDRAGRLFGAFLGIGVDPAGLSVGAGSFGAFDLDAPGETDRIARFIAYTAGRFVFVLDVPEARRIYLDPVGHLSLLFNARLGRAGSSVSMVLDRPIEDDPEFDCEGIAFGRLGPGEPFAYALGRSRDREVRFLLPNHYLDLDSFAPVRHWPTPDSFPEAPPEEYEGLVRGMVSRQKAILRALTAAHPSILAVSGGSDSRKLLACLAECHGNVGEYFCFEHTAYARLDAVTGDYVTSRLGLPFRRYRPDPARRRTPFERRDAKRRFWVRSSWVAAPPNEHTLGFTDMTPEGHLHLRGNVMDLMRAVWWRGFPGRNRKVRPGLASEIGALFLASDPPAELAAHWEAPYLAWRDALPGNARALVYDFIFLELFLTVSSAKYYAYERNFYICPFADRWLIETTLRFPVDHRFSLALNEAFLAEADPRLAGLPYRGGVRALVESGEFVPRA